MKSIVGSLVALFVVSAPRFAAAEEPRSAASVAEPEAPAFEMSAGLGVTVDEARHEGGVMDFLALARFGVVGVGGSLQLGTRLLSDHYAYVGPSVGVFAPTPRWLELGVVGTLGARAYAGVGAGFGGDHGASAVLPSAGARAIAAMSIPVRTADRPVRIAVGMTALAEDDLQREAVSYSYDNRHPWFGGTPGRVSDSASVGTARYAGLLTLGASY